MTGYGMKCSSMWPTTIINYPEHKYLGTLGHHSGSIWTPWGTILVPSGYPGAPFWGRIAPFWWPAEPHGPTMGYLGVRTWTFIDSRCTLGSPWGLFWGHPTDFVFNWVATWTALVWGLKLCQKRVLGCAKTIVKTAAFTRFHMLSLLITFVSSGHAFDSLWYLSGILGRHLRGFGGSWKQARTWMYLGAPRES